MKNYFGGLTFAAVVCFGLANKLPSTFRTCNITRPDADTCLQGAILDAIQKLKNGISDLKIPSLEPLFVPSMTIGEGHGAVHVIQNYRDINLYGLTKSNITKVDASKIKDFKLYTESFTPELRLVAKYNISGRLLLLPIQGEGDCTISLHNVAATHNLIGEKLERNGKTYLKVNQYLLTLHPAKVQFDLKNLFNGDQRLGKEMNNLLNENWKEVFEDVRDGYEESLGLIFGSLANKLFNKVPFKDIFLQ